MTTAAVPSRSAEPLAYAQPTYARPNVILFYIAAFCWAAPLLLGGGILLLYAVTWWRPLPLIGAFIVLAGGLLFGVGIICGLVFARLLRRCAPDIRAAWARHWKWLAALLLTNLPIAAGCMLAGVWLMGRYAVVITNNTGSPLQNVTIDGAAGKHSLGTIAPRQTVRRTLSAGEGDLAYSAEQNGTLVSGRIDVYLDGMSPGTTTITFNPSGVSAKSRRH